MFQNTDGWPDFDEIPSNLLDISSRDYNSSENCGYDFEKQIFHSVRLSSLTVTSSLTLIKFVFYLRAESINHYRKVPP